MEQLLSAGEMPTGHMLAQWRGLMGDLGLSDTSRTGATPGNPPSRRNRFDEFR
jgi:hypothetical protein